MMKPAISRVRRIGAAVAPVLAIGWLGSGCDTLRSGTRNPAEQRRQQDMAVLEERLQSLTGRIENLQMEADANRAELAALRRDMAAQSDMRATRTRLDDLDRRLKESDAAREKDREQILNSLSSRMAEILQRGGGTSPTRRPRPAGRQVYEHVVRGGESLSRIAAAYNVTVQDIKEENQLTSDRIRVGQTLYIPGP